MRRSLKIAAGAALATLVGMTGAQALQVIPGVAGYRDSWPQAFGQPSLVGGTNWSATWTAPLPSGPDPSSSEMGSAGPD